MHGKRSRKWWQLPSRPRCHCGLPWECLELRLEAILRQEAQEPPKRVEPKMPRWTTPTMPSALIGRAGGLTPVQTYRARGGHPC